jgi:hypothetical protein
MERREFHREFLLINTTGNERIKLLWKDGTKIYLKEMGIYNVDLCGWVSRTKQRIIEFHKIWGKF